MTGVLHVLPVLTEACRPPEGGMNSTADVLPLGATAIPKPLEINCGALKVCAPASTEQVPTHAASNSAINFQFLLQCHIRSPLMCLLPSTGALFVFRGPKYCDQQADTTNND